MWNWVIMQWLKYEFWGQERSVLKSGDLKVYLSHPPWDSCQTTQSSCPKGKHQQFSRHFCCVTNAMGKRWPKHRQDVQWNEKGSKEQPPLGLPVREAWLWIRVTAAVSRELCPDPADVTSVLVLHWAGCWTRFLRTVGFWGWHYTMT